MMMMMMMMMMIDDDDDDDDGDDCFWLFDRLHRHLISKVTCYKVYSGKAA